MPIKRLPVKHGDEISFRDLQARLTEIGRIRLGVYNPDKGGRGGPEKLDRFRFTSPTESLIRAVADLYGGTVGAFRPQGSKTGTQYEVISETAAVPVYVPPQRIDPWLEAWGAGGCVRRCDGITEVRSQENTPGGIPCLCAAGQVRARDVCKPTARIQLELADVPAIGTWRLETHGDKFAEEISGLAEYVNLIPQSVPAMLFLEARRAQPKVTDRDGNTKRLTTTVYVPHLLISVATPAQYAVGGDTLTRAIEVATGAQAAIETASGAGPAADERPAIESAANVTVSESHEPLPGTPPTSDEQRIRTILAAIEAKTTVAEMDELQAKLQARGVKDEQVRQAWRSRYDALVQRDEIEARKAAQDARTAESRVLGQRVQEESLTVMRDQERLKRHHDKSWLGEPEHRIGDKVTVGGMTFTKIADPGTGPFGPDGGASEEPSADWPPVLDAEEEPEDRGGTDDVAGPDGQTQVAGYDLEFELNRVWLEGGKRGQTTTQTSALIKQACGVAKVPDVGPQHAGNLHELADGLADGSVTA